jgi:hypothetical protein
MENKIKGGKADKMSLEDIARKHKVFLGTIKKEFDMGCKVEHEHTTDPEKAKEITMDHLVELPDYYTRLGKMEKEGEHKLENKEQTMSDASGSFEGALSGPILKKDIHKLHNFNKKKEVKEQGIGSSGAYDAPIGTAGPSSPMDHTKKKRKDPLALDEKGKASSTASITAASTNDMVSTKKGFPRFGGPDAKFVEIDKKCKTYPYCNQGDSGKKFKFISEIKGMKEAIEFAAKKHGLPFEQVAEMVLKESQEISEALPRGMMDDPGNSRAIRSWTDKGPKPVYNLTTQEPLNIKTTDDIEIAKLKMILHTHDIKFQIEVGEAGIDPKPLHMKEPQMGDEDDDGIDFGDSDDSGDIFANMNK